MKSNEVYNFCNNINKVCALGMKSIMLAVQTIDNNTHRSSNEAHIAMLARGMESEWNPCPIYRIIYRHLSLAPPFLAMKN